MDLNEIRLIALGLVAPFRKRLEDLDDARNDLRAVRETIGELKRQMALIEFQTPAEGKNEAERKANKELALAANQDHEDLRRQLRDAEREQTTIIDLTEDLLRRHSLDKRELELTVALIHAEASAPPAQPKPAASKPDPDTASPRPVRPLF